MTKDDATFAAAGAELKKQFGSIAQAFNLKVQVDKTASSEAYLAHIAELLKERMASKDYGSGSGVSNLDLLAGGKPLPELARTPLGRQLIIEGMKRDIQRNLGDIEAVRDYWDENKSLGRFRFPSELKLKDNPREPFPRVDDKAPKRSREDILKQYGVR
jgi:hypothetical protein